MLHPAASLLVLLVQRPTGKELFVTDIERRTERRGTVAVEELVTHTGGQKRDQTELHHVSQPVMPVFLYDVNSYIMHQQLSTWGNQQTSDKDRAHRLPTHVMYIYWLSFHGVTLN